MDAIIENLKLQDKARSFSWIKEQYDNKKLYISEILITETIFEDLRKAIKLVNDVYENMWDIEIVKYRDGFNIKGIDIYFPLVNLTNKNSKSHIIKDLFVKIPLFARSANRLGVDRLQGSRSTVSYAEYCSEYFHSHLSAYIYNQTLKSLMWYPFCTGSGEINMYQANINTEGITEENFMQYLIQIMTLVSYESIEGTPYRHIESIMIRSRNRQNYSIPSSSIILNLINSIKLEYHNSKTIPELNFRIVNNKYEVLDDELLSKFIKEGVITESQKKIFLTYKDFTNVYYKYGEVNTSGNTYITPNINRSEQYIFQGKVVPFVVENIPEQKDVTNVEYIIHPKVREYIKNKIENDVNKTNIRKSTINRYQNSGYNASESTESNTVSV